MLILDLKTLVFSKDNVFIKCICLLKHWACIPSTSASVGLSNDEIWNHIHWYILAYVYHFYKD
jgi:hypothetical protein